MEKDSLRFRLSHNLKRLRRQHRLTQFQLAEKAGLSPETVNSIECCRMWVSDSTLQKICNALCVDAVSLLLPRGNFFAQREKIRSELRQVAVHAVKNIVEREMTAIL